MALLTPGQNWAPSSLLSHLSVVTSSPSWPCHQHGQNHLRSTFAHNIGMPSDGVSLCYFPFCPRAQEVITNSYLLYSCYYSKVQQWGYLFLIHSSPFACEAKAGDAETLKSPSHAAAYSMRHYQRGIKGHFPPDTPDPLARAGLGKN